MGEDWSKKKKKYFKNGKEVHVYVNMSSPLEEAVIEGKLGDFLKVF